MRILDIFPYFNEQELLELRIKLLNDKIDQFIICEANRTQSGIVKDFTANKLIQKLNLPLEKIKVIECDFSKYDNLIDDNYSLIREREQRNIAKQFILSTDIAIVSDCDEIINPAFIDYYSNVLLNNNRIILKIPMVFLSGRANLQVYDENDNPRIWNSSFMCLGQTLDLYTLSDIRESRNSNSCMLLENNQIDFAGWHFSWMNDIINKYKAGMHYTDFIDDCIYTYTDQTIESFMESYSPKEGSTDALGRRNHILKQYDINLLPKLIFDLPNVFQFLLSDMKYPHFYQNSNFGENWFTYPNLYKSMVFNANFDSNFVEVGSWKGKSSAFMCVEIINSKKDINFYCVDTWEGSEEHKSYKSLENLYNIFLDNMKPVEKYYTPIRLSSVEASKTFANNSLDFVFIDASHDYDNVIQDILAWTPKIKGTGILAGHDYYPSNPNTCGVYNAVNDLFKNISFSEDCFIIDNPNKNIQYFKYEYQKACDSFSDISEHLPILYSLAKKCRSVTELGVRTGMSTRAFLHAGIKLRSYDLELNSKLDLLFNLAQNQGLDVKYIQGDSRLIVLEPCDLLFIDTLHTYPQLKKELEIHVDIVNRYLVFHDTHIFGVNGENNELGLLPAILEFLRDHHEWKVNNIFTNNNGLLILEKTNEIT